jgi:Glycosyltransferases involved in cell wall biogenesis
MINKTQEEITAKWKSLDTEHPLVSIKCLTYNHEKFIAQTMDGFLIQETDFPFEIIVHDDASTDKTADILREYEKKFPLIVKPVYETENQYKKQDGSLTRAANAPLKGKYIANCEGDDYWIDPHKLQTQIDFLESHPDYSTTFHDAEIKTESGVDSIDSVYPQMEDREYSATEIFEKWTIPTASLVYRREVINYPIKNIFNILNGDLFLVEKCAHTGKVRCINKKMSVYRIHPNGVTWDQSKKIQRIKEYPAHLMELKIDFPKIDRRILNRAICGTFVNAWDYIDTKTKIYYFFKGLTLAPKTFLKKLYRKKFSNKA